MSDKYRQIVKQLTEKPWAIMPSRFEVILDIVRARAQGEKLSEAEIEARINGGPGRRTPDRSGTVAVLPLSGPIVPKAGLMTQVSGATSVQSFRDQYLAAMNDPDVSAIVLDVDSPGGVTDLLPELAATMRQMRGKKPVLAVADTLMASAAYWISSQADEVAVTPSGLAGSIGVFAAHDDFSEQMAADGIKTTLISAGKYKTEGNPYEPLSDEARAHLQELVDSTYAQFTLDVARGRGVAVDTVRNGYGEGRVLDAKTAVKAGLADHVASLEETITRAAELATARSTRSQAAFSISPVSTTGNTGTYMLIGEKGPETQGWSLVAGPIRPHSTATTASPWDGPQQKANLSNDKPETYREAFAWYDSNAADPDGDGYPDAKGDYKFIHHMVSADGTVGAANTNGCSAGIAVLNGGRGGTTIPAADRQGVYDHLARHIRDAGKEPPPLQSLTDIETLAEAPVASLAGMLNEALCAAEELVDQGRQLTAAKREQFEALRERIDLLVAEPPRNTLTMDDEFALLSTLARTNR